MESDKAKPGAQWAGTSLDPTDWHDLRQLGHRMLDDMIDHLAGLRTQPVWQEMPRPLRQELHAALPHQGIGAGAAYDAFRHLVQPYSTGNTHPGFMGWVHGGGNPVGMLAELLAGGLNANLGGRDHAPIEVERQVIRWAAEMLGLPADSGGLLVTGTSIANMISVLAARTAKLGRDVRRTGLNGARLVAYSSAGAHGCIPRAMDMAGLGVDALHLIPADANGSIRLDLLADRIAEDRAAGDIPFLVAATAGTVDIGAIDDLDGVASICAGEHIWFHVDAAFGALAMLSPRLRPLLRGIERADSVAFDFHKWGQIQYDAGCVVVRDASRLIDTFGQDVAYLKREARGLAGGHPWPCDLGPDLSRGFRALKVWMTLLTYGADRIGGAVEACCDNAAYLEQRLRADPRFEVLAPVRLNIVCFRMAPDGRRNAEQEDRYNADLVADVQESGLAAPSTTRVGGTLAIRAAIVNHRTEKQDMDRLITALLEASARRN